MKNPYISLLKLGMGLGLRYKKTQQKTEYMVLSYWCFILFGRDFSFGKRY